MAPKAAPRRISQEAFDASVRENVEELGMDEEEALEDAIHTLKLQGVDLSGIITSKSSEIHPVVGAIRDLEISIYGDADDEVALEEALKHLKVACNEDGSSSIAVRNGAVQAAVSACKILHEKKNYTSLAVAFDTLLPLINDEFSRKEFESCSGQCIAMASLKTEDSTGAVPRLGALLLAAAATENEFMKQKFMGENMENILVALISSHKENAAVLAALFEAVRALSTDDDRGAISSQAYQNVRAFARAGMIEALLDRSSVALKDPVLLPDLCRTLKAISWNEMICNRIAKEGGVDVALQFVDDVMKYGNVPLAKNASSLLAQLAGSDAVKDEIVSHGGCEKLVTLAFSYLDEPSVLQEVMSVLGNVSLRAPANASKAVEAGAVDLAVEVMEKHPTLGVVLKHTCQMLRNLAVRNPENRPIILEKGLEAHIREAKSKHTTCKDAASAALRDLGLDDYN